MGLIFILVILTARRSKDAESKLLESLEVQYGFKLSQLKDYFPKEYNKIEEESAIQAGNDVAMLVCSVQEKLDELSDSNIN